MTCKYLKATPPLFLFFLVAALLVLTDHGWTFTNFTSGSAHLIFPRDLVYKGAFRLPGGSNGSNWEYSGYAMTYYHDGDPTGPNDRYPGSIFAIGHDHQQYVSEISIPVPVILKNKNPAD